MKKDKNSQAWPTEMIQLNDKVYAYIQTKGALGLSNAGLIIGDNYTVVVDTLNSFTAAQAFFKGIRKITDKPTRYVIITHSHPDHIWGNYLLPEAVTISHSKSYQDIKQMGNMDFGKMKKAFASQDTSDDPKAVFSHLPDITFDTELDINITNSKIHLIYYGFAHSLGDIVVYLPDDGIVFCGDLLFSYVTPMGFGGYYPGWIEAINKIAELDASLYIPGHGPPCNRAKLIKFSEYLTLIHDEAQKAFKEGLTYREAATRMPLGEFKEWAEPERILGNVACIYRELKQIDPESKIDLPALMMEMREFSKTFK